MDPHYGSGPNAPGWDEMLAGQERAATADSEAPAASVGRWAAQGPWRRLKNEDAALLTYDEMEEVLEVVTQRAEEIGRQRKRFKATDNELQVAVLQLYGSAENALLYERRRRREERVFSKRHHIVLIMSQLPGEFYLIRTFL